VYVNCGDWVDSCTAIVEHFDGRLELVRAAAPAPLAQARPARSKAPVDTVPPRLTFEEPAAAFMRRGGL
jgi:hypothetical protein